MVGAGTAFVPDRTGILKLRMYDTQPDDNEGVLKVEIQGTFNR